MIKSISFKNYRSFKTKQTIDIKPITILVGPNSSGKSSILKLFGLLKQSVFNRSSQDTELLKYNGEEVQLDSLEEICYRKKPGELTISFKGDLFLDSSDLDLRQVHGSKNIDTDPHRPYRSQDIFECILNLKHTRIKDSLRAFMQGRESEFLGDKTRDRFRLLHTINPSNTIINLYKSKKDKKIAGKKFNYRGTLNVGSIFTNSSRWDKLERPKVKLIREDIKNDLCEILKILQKLNNKYNKQSNLNREIDEIVCFVYYEIWFRGNSFFPENITRQGNPMNDEGYEIKRRPTPNHGYLTNWEDVSFNSYSEELGTMPFDDDAGSMELFHQMLDPGFPDHISGKPTRESQILYDGVLKRIRKHWRTVEKSDSYNNRKFKKNIEQTIWWYIVDLVEFHHNPFYENRSDAKDKMERWMRTMSLSIKENLTNVVNIKAIRPSPKKFYTFNELKLILGENVRKYSFKASKDIKFENEETYLSMLSFDHSITISKISDSQDLFTITLMSPKDKLPMTVDKFGFGFSQILPLVFARSHQNKLIIVEQPELHLHPKAQSGLADFFSKRVNTSIKQTRQEKGSNKISDVVQKLGKEEALVDIFSDFGFVQKRKIEYEVNQPIPLQNKFLIETHSEHLIRRFQVLIANGELSNDDIAIYYVDKNRLGNSIVKEYKINERGFFTEPWPGGFFDSTSKSLMELWKPR